MTRRTRTVGDSPITAAYDLLEGTGSQCTLPLLDLGQAAPTYPPAPEVVEHAARIIRDPAMAGYTEVPGLPRLRKAVANDLEEAYRGRVSPGEVLITAGCNQAFCLVVSALTEPGDEVVLVLPYYFNHDMWLRLSSVTPRYLEPANDDLVPRVDEAAALITSRTRAIVLVTPGNPSGVTIPSVRIAEFAELAKQRGIVLILDETYRSFRDDPGPAHDLFADPNWTQSVVSLHSFSKDLALPGFRVGAVVASAAFNREVAKLADCVAVCAPRIGQEAAWAGLTHASHWRSARARELAARRRSFVAALNRRPGGFRLISSGGFFGWIQHPFAARSSNDVVSSLVARQGLLVIPGTAFRPDDRGLLRVSVGNLDPSTVVQLVDRLTRAGEERSR